MDAFNRVVALVFGFVVLVVGVTTVWWTLLIAGPYSVTSSAGDQWNISRLAPSDQVVGVVAGLLVGLLGLVLCAIELLGSPRQGGHIMAKVKGNRVEIETGLIQTRIHDDVMRVAGILDVAAHVSQQRQGVRIHLGLTLPIDVTVPAVVEEAVNVARSSLESGLGLRVDRVLTTVMQEPTSAEPRLPR